MRQSQLFTKTKREFPKDEEAVNAQLLIKAGFIDKLMAGVYTFLPLGNRVLSKIENIIRHEMNAIGGQEVLMPALQPKEIWQQTDRWDSLDVLFRLQGAGDKDLALGPTHEEVVTPMMKGFVFSYKDLPTNCYQFQTKFRNEPRAKSGLLRGREFRMKDLYSFHTDEKSLDEFYLQAEQAYEKIWENLGLSSITHKTYAAGGTFAKYSHEYQTLCPTGEDTIYLCEKCGVAVNKEIIGEQKTCPECGNDNLVEKKSIEVGNIFKLKDKFSSSFKFTYTDEDGTDKPVMMGCYGLGPSRVMGAIVEVFGDASGIVWPDGVAPFKYHLVNLSKDAKVKEQAESIYNALNLKGEEILYDDREDSSPGEKLKDADLIGIPIRLVVSDKTDGKIEVKKRNSDEIELKTLEEL